MTCPSWAEEAEGIPVEMCRGTASEIQHVKREGRP